MPTYTDNHELQKFTEGEEPWSHSPDMDTLEVAVSVKRNRAPDTSQETPHDGAVFLNTSTGDIYVGDGASWGDPQWNLGSADALTETEGIATTSRNVGAMVNGGYHTSLSDPGGYGVVFQADDIRIHSVVVDADLSGTGSSSLPIELRPYEGGSASTVIESTTVSLSGGPERVQLDFDVPLSGASNADANNEYLLHRGDQPTNPTPLRRRYVDSGGWSAGDYADETYTDPQIDFLRGAHQNDTTVGEEGWYYFFDWLVGPDRLNVTSPWSTDVDEIYMRPRDPTEEFDNVSPRALWIQT